MAEDWTQTTERLIQNEDIRKEFEFTDMYLKAFEVWASNEYPEEYKND